jgi:hypothetical protein
MRAAPIALALLLGLAATAQADVLALPESRPAVAPDTSKPAKGMTQTAVLKQYGQPSQKHKPFGGSSRQQPPITRWDYPGFVVFFEYDHVIDAVIPGSPPTLQRAEELQPAG